MSKTSPAASFEEEEQEVTPLADTGKEPARERSRTETEANSFN